jgi:phospholipid transport system substrate-binding protein
MRQALFILTLIILPSFLFGKMEVENFVNSEHEKIFSYIETSKVLLKNDKEKYLAGLEKAMENLIAPEEISKRVLGKKIYTLATKEQRAKFSINFKTTLFDSYSSALTEIDKTNVLVDSHIHPNERLDLAIVKLKADVAGKEFDFIYKMKKINKNWKVIGIIIDGIDLISIFRKQFNKLLLENNNDINFAINNWELEE